MTPPDRDWMRIMAMVSAPARRPQREEARGDVGGRPSAAAAGSFEVPEIEISIRAARLTEVAAEGRR